VTPLATAPGDTNTPTLVTPLTGIGLARGAVGAPAPHGGEKKSGVICGENL